MHYYIAEWIETTDDAGLVFRPPMDEAGQWSVIDLRPDASVVDGYCLIASDQTHPTTPGLWYLTDDLDANLSPPIKNYIQNGLGITLAAPTLRGAIAEIMLVHARLDGTRWKPVTSRKGLVEIYLRGLVYAAPEIVGSVYTESFNTSNSDTIGPDLTWSEIDGDMDIESNRLRLTGTGSGGLSYVRAQHDTAGDDQYAQFDLEVLNPRSGGSYSQVGVCARHSSSAISSYMWFIQRSDVPLWQDKLRKTVTGTRSDLTSAETLSAPTLPIEMKLTVIGTTLKGYVDDAEIDTVTDSTFSGSGNRRAGVYAYVPATPTAPYIAVDNFEFGDNPVAGGIGGWGILPAS